MKELIEKGHDFRIIPENFESATVFDVKSANELEFVAQLSKAKENELKDYDKDSHVEIFGSSAAGLIFFETDILKRENDTITLKMPTEYKNIQRREYSRVPFEGEIELNGSKESILSVEDISAGGIKIITKEPLNIAQDYPIKIKLINNLTFECKLHPIRIEEEKTKGKMAYVVSGCYKDIKSIDRIALVQYTFKILMEAENKENE